MTDTSVTDAGTGPFGNPTSDSARTMITPDAAGGAETGRWIIPSG